MPPSADTAPRRGRVLVVEDEVLIRLATMDMIEQLGLEGVEAGNAADALAHLARDSDIDTLLTDLGLPGMTGRELVTQARTLRPGLRVIVATGYSSKAANVGEDTVHLDKPFALSQLRKALGL